MQAVGLCEPLSAAQARGDMQPKYFEEGAQGGRGKKGKDRYGEFCKVSGRKLGRCWNQVETRVGIAVDTRHVVVDSRC